MPFRLPVFIIPIVIALLCAVLWAVFIRKKHTAHRLKRLPFPKLSDAMYGTALFGLLGAGQIVFGCLADLFIHSCMAMPRSGLPVTVMIVICLLSSLALFLQLSGAPEKPRRLTVQAAVLALVLIIAEVSVFNAKSFSTDHYTHTFPASEMEIETPDLAALNDTGIIEVKGNAQINLHDLPDFTRGIIVHVKQDEGLTNFRMQLKMKDTNASKEFIGVGDRMVGGRDYPCEFTLVPYGDLQSIQLHFLEVYNRTVTLSGVTVMSALPFRFSLLRYFFLLTAGILVLAVRITGFAKVRYDHSRRSHRLAAACMTILCVSSILFFHVPEQGLVHYPLEKEITEYDPYIQTFDAFQKGQVWLDIEADPGLAELENVYDRALRAGSGFRAQWDRAYFEGKYYSYFGITPVLILHYPIYMITGALPDVVMVNEFFGFLAILFLCFAMQAVMRLFAPKANFLLYLLMMPVMTCVCGVFYCFQTPDMYGAAVVSALCFTFAAIWLGCSAFLTMHKPLKFVQLACCGLAVGLAVGSRPSMAVSVLVLAPVFLSILLDKEQVLRFRLWQAFAFLLPVLCCAAGLMYYNYIRFGSPLDFGAAYQLTVSDIHANHLRLSALPTAILHYFLYMPGLRNAFPFFGMTGLGIVNYQMYTYIDIIIGAFFIPVLLAGTLLLPASLRMQPQATLTSRIRERGFLIGCFVMALFIAWADFCLAGVHLRYLFDLMPLMILGSTASILRTTAPRRRTQYGLVLLTLVLSVIMIGGLMLSDKGQTTAMKYPALFETLEDAIVFWQ